jgi:hypothetical protein
MNKYAIWIEVGYNSSPSHYCYIIATSAYDALIQAYMKSKNVAITTKKAYKSYSHWSLNQFFTYEASPDFFYFQKTDSYIYLGKD